MTEDDALPTAMWTFEPARRPGCSRCSVACRDGRSHIRHGCGGQKLLSDRLELGLEFPTQKAVVAHLVKAFGPDVLEETAKEFVAVEPHDAPLSTIASAILETHIRVGDLQDAVVGDRPAVQRASEVAQHCVGAMLGQVDVNLTAGMEGSPRWLESLDRSAYHRPELGLENPGENIFRREIAALSRMPLSLLVDRPGWHQAMHVWMVDERARPGVERCHDTDGAAEVPSVGRDLEQRSRRRAHEDRVKHALVLADNPVQLVGHAENNVKVGYREELALPPLEPFLPVFLQALWT